MDAVEDVIDELYRVSPEEFVAERDARVAAAKEAGDKDTARVIGAARRPSRAAWLTNLLVHDRPDEVEGLLGLADTLASAQRTLDGAALRAVSAQRNKLVGALSRRAAQLGRDAGHRVDSSLERDVRGILEAALADPELAGRVRTGRLEKAERHAGFGPEPAAGAEPRPAGPDGRATADSRDGDTAGAADHGTAPDDTIGPGAADRREAERREREIARAEESLDRAEQTARARLEDHERARAEAAGATGRQDRARDRVAELTDELDRARDEAAAANRAAHAASSAERDTARAARTAETARDRAAAALEELRSSSR